MRLLDSAIGYPVYIGYRGGIGYSVYSICDLRFAIRGNPQPSVAPNRT
jgi:hypothetical protein